MSECIICCCEGDEKVNCCYCQFSCCVSCWKKFIMEGRKTICINVSCKKEFNRKFIYNNFDKEWVTKEWNPMNRKKYVEFEKTLLPMTQYNLDNQNNFGSTSLLFRKCLIGNCRGYLNSEWQCGTCRSYTCSKCLSKKDNLTDKNHQCKNEMVETVSMLQDNTKNCPRCFTPIFKIDGCNQMWCSQCHYAFHWETGEIQLRFHNPHFTEFQQQQNLYVSRNPGDVECDRSLDNTRLVDSLCEKFSQSKRTMNTTNCCCRIEGTNKIVTGTKEFLELWEFDNNGSFKKIRNFYVQNEWICGMVSLPGTTKFIISLCGELQIWNYNYNNLTKTETLKNENVEGYISAIHFIPEYKLLLCGGRSKCIYYWIQNENGEFIFRGSKEQHTRHIYCINHIPNTNIILSGGTDNNIVVWKYKYNILCYLKTIDTLHETIRSIQKIPNYNRIVSVCHQYLQVWTFTDDFEIVEPIQKFPCHCMFLLNIPETNNFLTIGDSEHSIVLWSVDNEGNFEKNFTFTKKATNFTALYIPELNKIMIGNNKFNVSIWNYDVDLLKSIQYIIDIIKQTIYLKDIDSVPYEYSTMNNEHIRISYLKKKINEEQFEEKVYQEYIQLERNQEIKMILDLQIQGIIDITYRACLNNDKQINTYILEIDILTDLSNKLLQETTELYETNSLQIIYNQLDESVLTEIT